jgi:hypothetical protein
VTDDVQISEHARGEAKRAGIYGDVDSRLRRMLRRAAPVTSEYGNRRYQNYILFVQDNIVLDVARLDFKASAA